MTSNQGTKVENFVSGEHSIGAVHSATKRRSPHLVRGSRGIGRGCVREHQQRRLFRDEARHGRSTSCSPGLRAAENHRWLLRSTNDGITASIDPAGRVWDRFADTKRAVGRLRFGWEKEQTPYTRGGATGLPGDAS